MDDYVLYPVMFFVSVITLVILSKISSRQSEKLKECCEKRKNIYGKDYYLLKKRSSSLPIKAAKLDITLYEYKKDTPHYRTMVVGHVATTELVDNSGLVYAGKHENNKGYITIKYETDEMKLLYPTLDVNKALYDEFMEKYKNHDEFSTNKVDDDHYQINMRDMRLAKINPYNGANLRGYTPVRGYAGEYFASTNDMFLEYDLLKYETINDLVIWLKSGA